MMCWIARGVGFGLREVRRVNNHLLLFDFIYKYISAINKQKQIQVKTNT